MNAYQLAAMDCYDFDPDVRRPSSLTARHPVQIQQVRREEHYIDYYPSGTVKRRGYIREEITTLTF